MHKPSAYERYLNEYVHTYCWEDGETLAIPEWLRHEFCVYYWMFKWSRSMYLRQNHIPSELWNRMKNITTNSHGKYRNISPNLNDTVHTLINEINKLYVDLTSNAELLAGERLLSKKGLERWGEASARICDCRYVKPEPEWREEQERKRCFPFCTMKEAESMAIQYVKEIQHISLEDDDEYYHSMESKNHIFKMKYGKQDGNYNSIGLVTINMKTREFSLD